MLDLISTLDFPVLLLKELAVWKHQDLKREKVTLISKNPLYLIRHNINTCKEYYLTGQDQYPRPPCNTIRGVNFRVWKGKRLHLFQKIHYTSSDATSIDARNTDWLDWISTWDLLASLLEKVRVWKWKTKFKKNDCTSSDTTSKEYYLTGQDQYQRPPCITIRGVVSLEASGSEKGIGYTYSKKSTIPHQTQHQ